MDATWNPLFNGQLKARSTDKIVNGMIHFLKALGVGVLCALVPNLAGSDARADSRSVYTDPIEFHFSAKVCSLTLIGPQQDSDASAEAEAWFDVGVFPIWKLILEIVRTDENRLNLRAGQKVGLRIDRQTHATCRLSPKAASEGISRYRIGIARNAEGEDEVIMVLRIRAGIVSSAI
ncbi:hypothetical protein ASA1KI_28680 [Opitutales bacterium ASA1]|nr:hypothetical protein ASA1KI_28680 [Opitutales bacterium ASA1]